MKKRMAGLLACALLTAPAAAVETVPARGYTTSPWAQAGVQAAYEAGLVSPGFDLGEDYRAPVTRAQFARLAVELVAVERGADGWTLAEDYGLVLAEPGEEVPIEETRPEEPAEEEDVRTGDPGVQAGEPEEAPPFDPEGMDEEPAGEEPDEESEGWDEESSDWYGADTEAGLPPVLNGSFWDTNDAYVELAARLGIVYGRDGQVRPEDSISRAEAAAMLQRTAAVLGVTEADSPPQAFTDAYTIPRWAVESVKFVSGRTDGQGLALMGGANGKFSPQGTFTIEQSILTLPRLHATLGVAGVYAGWRDAPGYDAIRLALTFGGDCTLGRNRGSGYENSFDEMYDLHQNDLGYFFAGIPAFHNDDLTMVNFEGTLTSADTPADKTFVFKGPAAYAQVLAAGSVDVVTVANNHSKDYLQAGFDDTVRNLAPYVAVSGYDRMPVVEVKGVRIGFASNVGWSFDTAQKQFIENAVRTLRAQGADYIVFNYHWGIEKSYQSNDVQKAIGRYCIDQGADLVIGHHPHVVQEVEVYKGKPIAYSLGNLVFGGNRNPSDKNCLIFRQELTFDPGTRTVTEAKHEALPYRISSVTTRNDYHPVPAV